MFASSYPWPIIPEGVNAGESVSVGRASAGVEKWVSVTKVDRKRVRAWVIDEAVTVTDFNWPTGKGTASNAVCKRGSKEHLVDIPSLEWLKPHPPDFEWIEAYHLWREGVDDPREDTDE